MRFATTPLRFVMLFATTLLPVVLGVSIDDLFRVKEIRALALAERVSSEYEARCSSYAGCVSSSYDNCVTSYPAQTCPVDGIKVSACSGCGDDSADAGSAFFDYTVSTVRLPSSQSSGESNNNEPVSDEAAEAICYTRKLDPFFTNEHANDKASGVYAAWGSNPRTSSLSVSLLLTRSGPGQVWRQDAANVLQLVESALDPV